MVQIYKIKCKRCGYEKEVSEGLANRLANIKYKIYYCSKCKEIFHSLKEYCPECGSKSQLLSPLQYCSLQSNKIRCPKCKGKLCVEEKEGYVY
ncbi:hypothetical protein DRJ17_04970 [Candidatus Woesearchaeota archaeon]|nr:MAG: hypothetical protein DRJ17_04970 [Candidatus Woesearchaeota archaeon]